MLLRMKTKLNQDLKLPPKKKKIDPNDKIKYQPTSIKEGLNWLSFFDIMEFTADGIDNEKRLLPSLLKIFENFKINCWYNHGEDYQN